LLIFRFFVFIFFLLSCVSRPNPNDEFSILEGISEITSFIKNMNNPYGVLPNEFNGVFQNNNIIYKNYGDIIIPSIANRYYEFFVFDRNNSLFIFGKDPMIAINISSSKFYNHLKNEFDCIVSGNKVNNTIYYYDKVGRYEIGVMFAPNEIKRWNVDKRITLIKDLIYSAKKVVFFSLDMKDSILYSDLTFNKSYTIFYPNTISSIYPGISIAKTIDFSFIIGQDIELNDSLLKNFRGYSLDPNDLKKDFFIVFSSPIGTSSGSVDDGNYFKPNYGNYSFVLVIKGDLSKFFNFLSAKGFYFKNFELKFYFNNNIPYISWDKDRSVDIYYSTDGINYTFLSTTYSSFSMLSLEPGLFYTIRVEDRNTGERSNISFIYPKKPSLSEIKITEVLWMGSTDGYSNFTSDEFIEIKNISNKYIDISTLNLYVKGVLQIDSTKFSSLQDNFKFLKPNEYFLIINNKSYMFSPNNFNLDIIGVKYLASTSLSISNTFPYYIEIKDSNTLLDSVYMNGLYGYNSPGLKKSMVLKNSGWGTSSYSSFNNIFSTYTYCTPGFAYEEF